MYGRPVFQQQFLFKLDIETDEDGSDSPFIHLGKGDSRPLIPISPRLFQVCYIESVIDMAQFIASI